MRLGLLASFGLIFFAGCQIPVVTRVVAFHALPQGVTNKTFMVLPSDGGKITSMEFSTYAVGVCAELAKRGWTPIFDIKVKPDYLVWMDYSVDAGHSQTISAPIYGQTGGGSSNITSTVYSGGKLSTVVGSVYSPPVYGVVGQNTVSLMKYGRYLNMAIVDVAASTPGAPRVIYECRAVSEGRSQEISDVVPVMIRAVFSDFPGQSGKSRTITLR